MMVARSGLPWTCTGYYYSKLGGYGVTRHKDQESFDKKMMNFIPGSVNICVTNYDQTDIAKYLEHQGWTKTETDTKDLYVWSIKRSVFNEYKKKFNEEQNNKVVVQKKVEEEKQRRFGVKKPIPIKDNGSVRVHHIVLLCKSINPNIEDKYTPLGGFTFQQKQELRIRIRDRYKVDVPHIWNRWDSRNLTNSIAQRRRYNG